MLYKWTGAKGPGMGGSGGERERSWGRRRKFKEK